MSIFQVELGRAADFRFEPQAPPQSAPIMQVYGGPTGALALTVNLTAEKPDRSIASIIDRHTLELVADEDTMTGHTGDIMGNWFFKAHGLAQVRVNIASFDAANNRAHLSEPLPENAVGSLSSAGALTSGVWVTELAAGALGASVDRGAWYKIEYALDPDFAGASDKSTQVFYWSESGRIRVVKNKFSTGLTHTQLAELVPQFASARPPNRDTWQPMIDGLDIISLVESYLPSTVYADQCLGEQFRQAHAFAVAEHCARLGLLMNLSPDDAKEMAHQEFARQAQRVHFIDLDDDGSIDSGELAYASDSRVGLAASTAASTLQDYTDGKRYQPKMNNEDDR